MKKYRLAKDLPFAKAGAEVGYSASRIFVQRGETRLEACIDALDFLGPNPEIIQKELQRLIDEGWIEEVKPREFYIVFDKNSKILGAIDDQRTTFLGAHRFIKVREVLE